MAKNAQTPSVLGTLESLVRHLQDYVNHLQREKKYLEHRLNEAHLAVAHGCWCAQDNPSSGHFVSCPRGKLESELNDLRKRYDELVLRQSDLLAEKSKLESLPFQVTMAHVTAVVNAPVKDYVHPDVLTFLYEEYVRVTRHI